MSKENLSSARSQPESADQNEDRKHSFPNTRELAKKIAPEFGFDTRNKWEMSHLVSLLEFERAGRNLRSLCEKISRQEKRPVFVINNARTAAFLENGFKHWLANFASEDQADQFVRELEDTREYQDAMTQLRKKVADLKKEIDGYLLSDTILFSGDEDPEGDFSKKDRDELVGLWSRLTDITSDVRLCLKFDAGAPYDALHQDQTSVNIFEVYRLKDTLRAIILKQAAQWLRSARIASFVYPINHFKMSGSGNWEFELNTYGDAKLDASFEENDVLVVFADIHGHYPLNVEERKGSTHFPKGRLKKYAGLNSPSFEIREPIGSNRFRNFLRRDDVKEIYDYLEYPLSGNASGLLHSVQKRILDRISGDKPKILDLQVLMPAQEITRKRETAFKNEEVWKPNHDEYQSFDPFATMNQRGSFGNLNQKKRAVVDKLRGNPEWVYHFRTKIPIEPNYGYAGPEYS